MISWYDYVDMQIATTISARMPTAGIAKALGNKAGSKKLVKELQRRALHYDIQDAAAAHPTLRASVSAFGRSLIGPGWKLIKHPEYGSEATQKQRRDLLDYLSPLPDRPFSNFKDIFTTSAKLWATAGSVLLFGHTGWENIRNGLGKAIGFDNVLGFLQPNVDDTGEFQDPAYTQFAYKPGGTTKTKDFNSPEDVVFFAIPDIVAANLWNVDIEALADFSLPSDIYAMLAYLSLHKHLNTPLHGLWEVDADVSDEDFDKFFDLLNNRYTGSENYAKNPLVIRGAAKFVETARTTDDAPYLDGRGLTQREIDSVTGVPALRRGDVTDLNRASAREVRREFWESTLKPWVNVLEEAFWSQVCVREFGARGWWLKFEPPDFLTGIERASVDMRDVQWGLYSPNEVRERRGDKPREGGDYYLVPLNMAIQGEQGGPPEPVSDTDGDMPPSEDQPVGGQEPPERPRETVLAELRAWRNFAVNVAKGKRRPRHFVIKFIGPEMENLIRSGLKLCENDPTLIAWFFNNAERQMLNGKTIS